MNKFKKCLVTGGAGFIGSHLTKELLKRGGKVIVVDDFSEGKIENLPVNKNLKIVRTSILEDISEHFKGVDVIYHLAALPRLKRSLDDPINTHNVNVNGTFNLLCLAKKYNIKRFVFASSSSVYGNNKIPFKENMIPDPLVPYSLHKVIGEDYCKMFSSVWKLSTVSLRYFNVYGPGMNPNSPYANLIPKFIKFTHENKVLTINGDGRQTRDFTYIDDVVKATIKASKKKFAGEIINIGYGQGISVNKVYKNIGRFFGKNMPVKYGPEVIEPKATLASNTKAYKLLKWKPKIDFREGLKKTIWQTYQLQFHSKIFSK